ncbi:MAG: exodeoxyribonuclease VII small subunit [Bacteroidota bacterium]
MSKQSTYDDAIKELHAIMEQLQNNEIPMDELAAKVKRAAALIKYCQEKLRTTEEDIQTLFGA